MLMGPDAPPPKGRSVVHRLIAHLRANMVGWVALFVALGGTGYAAISIPRNSVGAAQIRNHSITPVKFNPVSIGGSVRAWAIVRADGSVIASAGKPVVFSSAVPGTYGIQWAGEPPQTCATVANVDDAVTAPTRPSRCPEAAPQNVVDRLRQPGAYPDRYEPEAAQVAATGWSRSTSRASPPRWRSTSR